MIPCRRRSGFLISVPICQKHCCFPTTFIAPLSKDFLTGISLNYSFKPKIITIIWKKCTSVFFSAVILHCFYPSWQPNIYSAVVPFISGSVLKRGGLTQGDIPCITEPCFKKEKKGWRENPAAAAVLQGWRGPACLIPQIKSSRRVAVGSRGSMKTI